MIPEGNLKDVVDVVINFNQTNNGTETSEKIHVFYPEFQKAVANSIKDGCLDKQKLERNLSVLYVKKFREERFDYFYTLKRILETEDGRNYLKQLLK